MGQSTAAPSVAQRRSLISCYSPRSTDTPTGKETGIFSSDNGAPTLGIPLGLLALWVGALAALTAVLALSLGLLSDRSRLPTPLLFATHRLSPPSLAFPNLPCVTAFNRGEWVPTTESLPCDESTHYGRSFATCGSPDPNTGTHWQWTSEAVRKCGAERIGQRAAQGMLGKHWFVMAGDSIARLAFGALLRHLSNDGTQQMVFGHQDFEYELPCGIRASFFWAPYADNVTSLVEGWSSAGTVPDVLVMGTALWHMLHVGVPQDYGNKLSNLANALSRLESQNRHAVDMFWFSVTRIEPSKLRTEEKRRQMTVANVAKYNHQIIVSDILNAAEVHVVDMHALTGSCGQSCTADGVHFSNATYNVAIQVLGGVPLTIKCRLGVDDNDSYEELAKFISVVSEEGGITHFIMHARKAFLQGLNPHQNRTVPPLRHQWVFALRRDFPHLSFSLNGGVQSCTEVSAILESTIQGNKVEGIMVGRAAYHYPWQVLAVADTAVFGAAENPAKSRRQVLRDYAKYADSIQGRFTVEGHKQNPNTRSLTIPLLNMFHGEAGNRAWKQSVDKVLREAQSVSELLDKTLNCFSDEVLDAPPSPPPQGMTAAEWLETLQELPLPATGEYDSSVRSVDDAADGNGSAPEANGAAEHAPPSANAVRS